MIENSVIELIITGIIIVFVSKQNTNIKSGVKKKLLLIS